MKDYAVITNPMTWGQVTGAVFFYDYRPRGENPQKQKLYPLKIRLTYKGERVYYKTGYTMTIEDWKKFNSGKGEIAEARKGIQQQMETIAGHVKEVNRTNEFTFDLLNKRMARGTKNDVFTSFDIKIAELKKSGRVGNAVVYECALNSLKGYCDSRSLKFNKVTPHWLKDYEEAMIKAGKKATTRSMYLRCLRAIILASGVTSPFGKNKFQIKAGEGRKMALDKPQFKKLLSHPVTAGSTTAKMRDLFYFSYMANGMNIRDLVSLKWENIKNNVIVFERAKTARTTREERKIKAPVMPEMKDIIDRWGDLNSEYIFGYLHSKMTPAEVMNATKNLTRLMNKHINYITKDTGLPKISTYTARHCYASHLLWAGAPIALIGGQMGHSRITTTEAYLKSFNMDEIFKYNQTLTNNE
jgi:site-specific recombinase XerD